MNISEYKDSIDKKVEEAKARVESLSKTVLCACCLNNHVTISKDEEIGICPECMEWEFSI